MEKFDLIWEIFFDLSLETQDRLVNSANNLIAECAKKDVWLSLGEALHVIFQTVKFLDGKEIKK
jgi:hypothetical protein